MHHLNWESLNVCASPIDPRIESLITRKLYKLLHRYYINVRSNSIKLLKEKLQAIPDSAARWEAAEEERLLRLP